MEKVQENLQGSFSGDPGQPTQEFGNSYFKSTHSEQAVLVKLKVTKGENLECKMQTG